MIQENHTISALVTPGGVRKILPGHLARRAIVYVRQSSLQQVIHHQESTRLQYALKERAIHLGWSDAQVEVIDEDQGRSGASTDGRPGFQRLVADVGLGQVGLVLGIEMSRLARSCRDWYQLLEICALRQTLLADRDGVYDPSDYNDRLLLGLKGTMSEAELHLIKQRMQSGLRAKARRGELPLPLPMGYVRHGSGAVVKDPDAQAQALIQLVFTTFERCGSIGGVLRYLVAHDLQLPKRLRGGPAKGELSWVRPRRETVREILRNPAYTGTYAYGRRPVDPQKRTSGKPWSGRTITRPDDWMVCLHDQWPAYISWEAYLRHLRQIEANQPQRLGVPRRGTALLSGLIRCGQCGRRMHTRYSDNGQGGRYVCSYVMTNYGGDWCQSIAGPVVDRAVCDLVVQALEPASLTASLQVADDLEQERGRLDTIWRQRVERARYLAERAARQYDATEPEHRLVARELEHQWEVALQAEQEVRAAYHDFRAHHPLPLSEAERAAIAQLAADIPALWSADTTTPTDRQSLIRQLIEQVRVTVQGRTERVTVQVEWAGAQWSTVTLIRRVAHLEQLSYYPELLQRARELAEHDPSPLRIAQTLTEEGWHPASGQGPMTSSIVRGLLARQGIRGTMTWQPAQQADKHADEWTISDLAAHLDMPARTLYAWARKGLVRVRRVLVGRQPILLAWADQAELRRLHGRRTQGTIPRHGEAMGGSHPPAIRPEGASETATLPHAESGRGSHPEARESSMPGRHLSEETISP